jgi:NAD(P)-dependent dehydrogenase (short-subunit alcohol dehydrogenase family)
MGERPAIIITGGARRVGAALARYFARHGYDIALHYNSSQKEAAGVKKAVEKLGAECALFQHDLQDVETLPWLMKDIRTQMRHCTALINSASVFDRGTFADTDEALFDQQFTVNFKAPFFLTQAFAKTFGKGCVINILDSDISKTYGSHFAYLLSKKALAEFTPMAARALGPKIRVNGVCPGIVLPPDDEAYKAYAEKSRADLPLRQHPSPDDVAETAYWLVNQQSITGQIIYVDGGRHVL